MRILSIQLEGEGLPASISISAKPRASESKNWITVLSGENGTRKSVLLRLVTSAALNKTPPTTNHRWAASASLEAAGDLQLVLAASGTYSDRFPQVASAPISRQLGGFDLDNYAYFGPRYAGNIAGRGRVQAGLLLSMLENPIDNAQRARSVRTVLQCLGYSNVVRALVVPRKNMVNSRERTRQNVRNYVHKVQSFLNNSNAKFAVDIAKALADLTTADKIDVAVAGPLTPKDIVLTLDLKHVAHTRMNSALIPFLKAGLLTVESLAFERVRGDERTSISVDDLSSGQLQLLNTLLNLSLCVRDDSLIVMDEPENSLHPEWQRDYISLLRQSIACAKRCHAIVATHSPLVASGVRRGEGSLINLTRDPESDAMVATLNDTVHGWLPSTVLEERFDMDSVRAPGLSSAVEAALRLLKTKDGDKAQLRKICSELRELLAELPPEDDLAPAIAAIIELGEE